MNAAGPSAKELLRGIEAGDERALARAISAVEDEGPGFEAVLHGVHDRVGRAHRVGLTGPPGVGKSTLAAALGRLWREEGRRVGIVAVDPTSPFTGGALLGDRVRMTELATQPGIFIRSMASRGSVGGLATATREVADLLDAFGFDRILIETLGVGQSELDVAGSADTTVVVLVPESGDGIQAMKAGLMEVADIFVVNKGDRPGADRLENEIQVMMSIRGGAALRGVPAHHRHHGTRPNAGRARDGEGEGERERGREEPDGERPRGSARASRDEGPRRPWRPPVLRTVASTGEGIPRLAERVAQHLAHLEASGELERRRARGRVERARAVLLRRARGAAVRAWEASRAELEGAVARGELSPYEAAERAAARLSGAFSPGA